MYMGQPVPKLRKIHLARPVSYTDQMAREGPHHVSLGLGSRIDIDA